MHALCEAARAGDKVTARAIDQQLRGLHNALFLESNPIPVKWAMEAMGLMSGDLRLPLTPLSASYHEVVRQALTAAGIRE